jgi:hypothetical protein
METTFNDYDDDDYDDLGEGEAIASTGSRGLTRSGAEFRKTNEGYYSSIKALKAAHPRVFSKESTLYIIGTRMASFPQSTKINVMLLQKGR